MEIIARPCAGDWQTSENLWHYQYFISRQIFDKYLSSCETAVDISPVAPVFPAPAMNGYGCFFGGV